MSDHEFWTQDMTTLHEKQNWFGRLSPARKLMFLFILLFVVFWCFFIGMQIAFADEPKAEDYYIVTKDDLGDKQLLGETLSIDGIHTILLMGCDVRAGYEIGRSDTMMLVFINGETQEISLLSIPRDCYVQIPGYSTKTKINHSYAYGGVELTMDTIEYFLGITIDDYVEVDFEGFKQLVDTLGGVEINVDQRMINYDEGINLNPGLQTLDGKQALGYCRFRIGQDGTSSVSDIKRAEHQQTFILALKDKLLSSSTVWKIPKLVNLANANTSTSISTSDAIKLGNTLLNMDLSSIKTYTITTGSMWINAISYEIVNGPATQQILHDILGPDVALNTHIIDDGGLGRYTLGDDEPADEETIPEIGEVTDPSLIDSGTDINTNPGTDSGSNPGGNTDPGSMTPAPENNPAPDVNNIPEPSM